MIAITNQKGGVGKTTTTVNLGIGLARQGKKVLMIDADPQASLSICLGIPRPDDLDLTLTDLMVAVVDETYICLTLAIVFYSLWTADTANAQTHLIWTVPLVICLCLKYYLTIDGNSDGDPIEVIFQDKVLLALIAAFAILTVVLLYLV